MKWCVIEFVRDVEFPKFSMSEGERWVFQVTGKNKQKLKDIKDGDRFPFAGGQCLSADVKIVYEGISSWIAMTKANENKRITYERTIGKTTL
jgi:hypothetical protein